VRQLQRRPDRQPADALDAVARGAEGAGRHGVMGFDISDGMIDVPAVQYMRPDGLLVDVTAPIPIECKAAYDEMTERGCRLAAEVLMTDEVSLTIEHDEGDFAIEVCPNGAE